VELCNLYASSEIIGIIEASRRRWAENVAHMEEMKNA
jgi:hypothetical protein